MKTKRGSVVGPALLTVALIVSAGSATAGIGGSSIAASAYGVDGSDIVAFGPVDATKLSGKQLLVLGQTVTLSPRTSITADGRSVSANGASKLLANSNGTLVAVYGALQSDGTIQASQIDFSSQMWVPGSTTVLLRGVVTNVNTATARAQVGSLSVDYSAGLYDPNAAADLKVGSVIELVGTQFSAGQMYASKVSTTGIGGSSKSGIGGSSAAGIGGSSTTGIGGSSKSGIGGSSASGIGGSSVTTMGIGGSS